MLLEILLHLLIYQATPDMCTLENTIYPARGRIQFEEKTFTVALPRKYLHRQIDEHFKTHILNKSILPE